MKIDGRTYSFQPAILESPFAGDKRTNRIFAENIVKAKLHQGFNCFASHLYYPHFLDDDVPEERAMGIAAGLQWANGIMQVFFALPEWLDVPSKGMRLAYDWHRECNRNIHCGIYNMEGACRLMIPEEDFFSNDGWIVYLKNQQEAKQRRSDA